MVAANEAALVVRYRPLALFIAREFFLPGQDADDVRQEACVGLLRGIRSFRPDRGASLDTFLTLAIRRHLITVLRQAQRQKQVPLNDSLRLGLQRWDPADGPDPYLDERADPALIVEAAERFRSFLDAFARLSPLERRGLLMVYEGEQYANMPERKRIDNAIQRARRKLREAA